MLSEKMTYTLNGQANRELYSSYLYPPRSSYFESLKLKGLANWMRVQAGEELMHGLKMYDYVINSSREAKMLSIESPQSTGPHRQMPPSTCIITSVWSQG